MLLITVGCQKVWMPMAPSEDLSVSMGLHYRAAPPGLGKAGSHHIYIQFKVITSLYKLAASVAGTNIHIILKGILFC